MEPWWERFLNRLWPVIEIKRQVEEINGHDACPTYLYRWPIFRGPRGIAIYLHHFVADDWSTDFHDHPKRFISIGLKGGYKEITPSGATYFQAPWLRSFPAEHKHRLEMFREYWMRGFREPSGERILECWTLVITGPAVRDWGFWHLGAWIPWRRYVEDHDLVERVKSC